MYFGVVNTIVFKNRAKSISSSDFLLYNSKLIQVKAIFNIFWFNLYFSNRGLDQWSLFFDYENYIFKMKFLGKERINTRFGKIQCMKFRPYVQSGRVFREQESVTLWITDDGNKIPIRLQADLAIGSIKVDLEKFKNLVAPFVIQFN